MDKGSWRAIACALTSVLLVLVGRPGFSAEPLDESRYREIIEMCVLISVRQVIDFSENATTELGRSLDPAKLPAAVQVSFEVLQSGEFSSLRMTASSGNQRLDQTLLSAIQRKAPFLRVPPEIQDESLAFSVSIPLREDDLVQSIMERRQSLDLDIGEAYKMAKVGQPVAPEIIPPDYAQAVKSQLYGYSAPIDAVLANDPDVQAAMDHGKTLSVTAEFSLNRRGRVIGSKIMQSSGITEVDKAVLQSISEAQPYPPAPEEMLAETLTFTAPFTFRAPPELARPGLQDDYVDEVQQRLLENITELERAIQYEDFDMERHLAGDPLKLAVELTIERSGTLKGARIATPSGHPAIDAALLRTAREAAPYPPIPDELHLETAVVTLSFAYSLH